MLLDCGAYANSGPATAAIALQIAGGTVSHASLLVRERGRLHQQGIDRLVPRARRADGQLRRRIADRPDRRRPRHRSARVPAAQRLSRGRQGTGRRHADQRLDRGVAAPGGRRDRLEGSQARLGPRQGARLLVVADHRRLVGRLCEDQSRRHGHRGERRGRARHRRDDRRGADPRRGAGRRSHRHQCDRRRHAPLALRLRRAGQPHGLLGRQCLHRRRQGPAAPDRRAGGAAVGRRARARSGSRARAW